MSTDLLVPGRTCWTVEQSHAAGVFIDARAYYGAFAQAALAAERQIFLSGWQFDTGVELVRGDDARDFPGPTAFLPFLKFLCERRPQLEIYILAWDFSVIFGLDRQWMQERMFAWQGHPRIHFVFDSRHPVGACQHQKLAIIDGHWAFTGGMDICNSRWDVPGHARADLRVNADGKEYPAKHDVQAFVEGAPATELARWFIGQWRRASKRPIPDAPLVRPKPLRPFDATVDLGAGPVGLSQTRGRTLLPPRRALKEIQELMTAALARADRRVYLENQYFTSAALREAILRRMFDATKGPLEVSLLLPRDRAALEFYSIAGAETRTIREVQRVAAARGHRFAVFNPQVPGEGGARPVWVHSKLMIVDDTFLTIGSANFDNRSMGFDTEVNLAWDAAPGSPLARVIADLRARLVAEHVGAPVHEHFRASSAVAAFEAGAHTGRLRPWAPPRMNRLIRTFRSEATILDPAAPTMDEWLESFLRDSPNSPIRRGLQSLIEWLSLRPRRAHQREAAREREGDRIAAGRR